MDTKDTLFVLIPNQHIGCWEVGFAPQWIVREYLSRRGATAFPQEVLKDSRCSLLGQHLEQIQVEGQTISQRFFDVSKQAQIGTEGYDVGAKILEDFFHRELKNFEHPDPSQTGKDIIAACMDGASVADYAKFSI